MEFYHEKLLPNGLPELLCQVIPEQFYFNTKVIAFPRKQRRGVQGSVNFNGVRECWEIKLYPTIMAFFSGTSGDRLLGLRGTYSFGLWTSFLFTSLHEIGHMVTWKAVENVPAYVNEYGHTVFPSLERHLYAETVADNWACHTAKRIVAVDPRIGQPEGPLGGYPGKLAYERRGGGRLWGNEVDRGRIAEWRAMKCGAQVPLTDIISQFAYDLPGHIGQLEYKDLVKVRAIVRGAIHRAAKELRIDRHFINKRGWRYLMFNAGESLQILDWLKAHTKEIALSTCWRVSHPPYPHCWRWELRDGQWEAVETDFIQIPREQLPLPFDQADLGDRIFGFEE